MSCIQIALSRKTESNRPAARKKGGKGRASEAVMESHKQSNRAERTKQRPAAQKDSNELYNDDDEDYDSDDIELLDLGDEAVLFGFDKAAAAEDDDKDNADHYQTDLDHIVTTSQDVTSPTRQEEWSSRRVQ